MNVSLVIKLVRHGQSLHNTGEVNANEVGDCNVPLSRIGAEQSRHAGGVLGHVFVNTALHYSSPYIRCRQTRACILDGAGLIFTPANDLPRAYEDPRLREMEFGVNKSQSEVDREKELRKVHGWFYYRMDGGESPANVYDRTSAFLESMMRQVERKKNHRILIVSHGITIRCFVMRFLHLSVEDYGSLDNPENCDIITITEKRKLSQPEFTCGKWGVQGLRSRYNKWSHSPAN